MKKPSQLPLGIRVILGVLALLAGLALSWKFFGLDGLGLLSLLPFIACFLWLCPELWRKK